MKLERRNHWYLLWAGVFAFVFFISAISTYAQPVTRLSGIPPLHSLKKFYSIPNFKIGGDYEDLWKWYFDNQKTWYNWHSRSLRSDNNDLKKEVEQLQRRVGTLEKKQHN